MCRHGGVRCKLRPCMQWRRKKLGRKQLCETASALHKLLHTHTHRHPPHYPVFHIHLTHIPTLNAIRAAFPPEKYVQETTASVSRSSLSALAALRTRQTHNSAPELPLHITTATRWVRPPTQHYPPHAPPVTSCSACWHLCERAWVHHHPAHTFHSNSG